MSDIVGLGPHLKPAAERTSSPWLDATSEHVRPLIQRALKDIGLLELSPNRSPRIDSYNLAAGVPVGSYWCASAAGAWLRECGFPVPQGYASCDNWMAWGKATKRWSASPSLGALVLYGVPGDARHIGLVVRLTPAILSVEGNTTVEGSQFEPNGTAVALKKVGRPDSTLGYVVLLPVN